MKSHTPAPTQPLTEAALAQSWTTTMASILHTPLTVGGLRQGARYMAYQQRTTQMLKAHKFQRDKSIPVTTLIIVGRSKMCLCGKYQWHPIHDPENWAKRYTQR